MTFLLYFTTGYLGWLAICAGVNAWTRPARPVVTDPVAEFRASLFSTAVNGRALPPGDHR
ncbi:hypothetical protein [Streptomyces cucumeris]|uniref:hypothetical protein n=1 Tax=Streptomyces cucumeris TaxID=2962890 RepID=UPI0020C868F7|nr:hypothetical protein [Streptomyces sp. NEAU-Y11]MCP9205554.1 hypothetical protein [Streptomyces sp. NEAU-Y11]